MATNDKQHWIADYEGNLEPASIEDLEREFTGEFAIKDLELLVSEHPEMVACPTKAGTAVFRAPKPAEYERFLGSLLGDNKDAKVKAGKVLAISTCVFPDRETFQSYVSKYPGIPSACTKPLNKIMGGELVARGKE